MEASSVLLLREQRQAADAYLRHKLREQATLQEATLFSEVLPGIVRTDLPFEISGGELYLLQPNGVTDWVEMHQNGVRRARAKAAANPRFEAYADIAEAELDEAMIQRRQVAAGAPSAQVRLSHCANDLFSDHELKQLGRSPDIERAFLRVSVFDGQRLVIYSRSIDWLDLADARGIATGWGLWDAAQIDLAPGASSVDILRTPLLIDGSQMSPGQMHGLADRLVAAYDQKLLERTGQVHRQGRNPEGIDTYKFVMKHKDLLDAHMSSLDQLAAAGYPVPLIAALVGPLRYDMISSFKQKIEGTWTERDSLAESVAWAGDLERSKGTEYYGCETVIGGTPGSAGYFNALGEYVRLTCKLCGDKNQSGDPCAAELRCTACEGHVLKTPTGVVIKNPGKSRRAKQPPIGHELAAELQRYETARHHRAA